MFCKISPQNITTNKLFGDLRTKNETLKVKKFTFFFPLILGWPNLTYIMKKHKKHAQKSADLGTQPTILTPYALWRYGFTDCITGETLPLLPSSSPPPAPAPGPLSCISRLSLPTALPVHFLSYKTAFYGCRNFS